MHFWQAIILGIVQGLAEFLPISSSGHLLMLQDAMNLKLSHDKQVSFDIALHAGTLIALVWYFRADLWALITAWLGTVRKLSFGEKGSEGRLAWLIILGTIPAIVAVVLFKDAIKKAEENSIGIATALILFSAVFLLADKFGGKQPIKRLGWGGALIIGIGQACALVPGFSRSGATISTAMLLGYERAAAARFSFLLSAPVVLAAVLQDAPHAAKAIKGDHAFALSMGIGFVASLIAGVIAVSMLIRFLQHHRISWFVPYRVVAGLAFLVYFLYLD